MCRNWRSCVQDRKFCIALLFEPPANLIENHTFQSVTLCQDMAIFQKQAFCYIPRLLPSGPLRLPSVAQLRP